MFCRGIISHSGDKIISCENVKAPTGAVIVDHYLKPEMKKPYNANMIINILLVILINSIIGPSFANFNRLLERMNRNEVSTTEGYWLYITDRDQLDKIIDRSEQSPVVIYKHSIRCGLSGMVWLRLKKDEKRLKEKAELYFLDLIRNRPISNEIATIFDVEHQSPQIIIVKNGRAIYHASHLEIEINKIIEQL